MTNEAPSKAHYGLEENHEDNYESRDTAKPVSTAPTVEEIRHGSTRYDDISNTRQACGIRGTLVGVLENR